MVGFAFTEDDSTECCIILRILREDDQFVKLCLVVTDTPFIPKLCDTHTPALLKKGQVSVGTAEQQDFGHECIAPCEYGKVLHDDGIGKGVHDLLRGYGGLDKVDNIRFGKDPAFGSDMVQFVCPEREFLYLALLHTHLHGTLLYSGSGT